MADLSLNLADIVDANALRGDLDAIASSQGDPASAGSRAAVLAHLKAVHSEGMAAAEAMLNADGQGRLCAKRLSHLQDVIIQTLYAYCLEHVFRASNLSEGEKLALVAIGGYGRGTLAPGSDVDLLFLLPYKQTALGEQVAEYILYMLWDMGLKVGHATRNVDECIRLSKVDMTICTSVLESRHLAGEVALFEELVARFDKDVVNKISSQFIQDKMAERDARHERMGETRYVVEPNVKEGKGGLRDLHTLFWIAKFFYRVRRRADLATMGVFNRTDYNLFVKCEDFLWAVRCHLHFMTGKAEERVSFDVQRELASRLGYQSHPGLENVERFMKHYFLITKDVGDLTRIFCAALEEQDLKQTPALNRLFSVVRMNRRIQKIRNDKDFIIDNKRINVADDQVFERDPVNLIRLFELADRMGLEYHPEALQLVRRSLRHIKKAVREDAFANRYFMSVLTSRNDPELNLRRMNEAGVLGRFIPDFGKIVAMMQFNMYHHYTVDEHLIRAVGALSKLEHGAISEDHPLATRLIPTLEESDRNILYVALLLHDIAKGRPEDHSVAGAAIARKLCPRFGFSAEDTETVAWLIREHLAMSLTAQSRDLSDRKTIDDFSDTVQTLRRLKLLVILTICDIRAVGPGVWNGWKGQLLRNLYAEAELTLTGGFSEASRADRAERARGLLERGLVETAGFSEDDAKHYAGLHYENYLLSISVEDQIRHTVALRELDRDGGKLVAKVKSDAFQAITEITVIAPDHPRLLSIIAGACSSTGALIDDAHIYTTADGRAIDVILINRQFDEERDELRRGARIGALIEDVLTGKASLPHMLATRARPKKVLSAFTVEPKVRLNNALSNRFSVIELEGLDRPGLLSDITATLSDLNLDIRSAHITTFGEKAVDTFYVTDLVGQKITDKNREMKIVEDLLDSIAPKKKAASSPRAPTRKTPSARSKTASVKKKSREKRTTAK